MVVSLEVSDGRLVAQHSLEARMSVYGGKRLYAGARYVCWALPRPGRELHATEVKVWVADPVGALCTECNCRGDSTCEGMGCPAQVCRCRPDRIGMENCATEPSCD
eukprot:jgi/Tetstr1/420485/TSEL_011598.t1